MQSFLLLSLFGLLFLGLASGVPVIFTLLGSALIIGLIATASGIFDPALAAALPVRIFGILENQILYAIPMFLLLGKVLEHSKLAERALMSIPNLVANPSPRALSISVIVIGLIIACTSGVVGATIIMLATLALPILERAGVHERTAAGLITASGSLGQIIPPSIVLILLSDQISNAHQTVQRSQGNFAPDPVTVGHLFAGAILPGLILALLYICLVLFLVPSKNRNGRASDEDIASPDRSPWIGLIALIGLVSVPAAILGGLATPTEAASIGVAYLIAIAVYLKHTTKLWRAFVETVELTGIIFGIIFAASAFALVVRGIGGDAQITALLLDISDDPSLAVIFVLAVVFVLGFLLEFVEITYVVVPVVAPALFAMGVDPLWFALLMALNLQISFLTPPMGISLFYYRSVSNIKPVSLFRAVAPFILVQILVLACLFVFPDLAIWLPSILI